VKPTRPLALLTAFLVAGAVSYGGVQLWSHYGTPPGVPASAPLTPAVLAAIILATALAFRSRLHAQREAVRRTLEGEPAPPLLPGQRAPKPVDPLQAARAVMFAKASSMVGAIVTGVYAGYAVYLLSNLDVDVYRSRAVVCGITVLAGIAMVAAALFLEYVLRVPPTGPEDGVPKNGNKTSSPPRSGSGSVRNRPEGTYPVRRT
jgi:fructose-specific phosphotransferase system IIC component